MVAGETQIPADVHGIGTCEDGVGFEVGHDDGHEAVPGAEGADKALRGVPRVHSLNAGRNTEEHHLDVGTRFRLKVVTQLQISEVVFGERDDQTAQNHGKDQQPDDGRTPPVDQ